MDQPKLIRKYVNRRLYDTSQSRYVNLEDLRKLIVAGAQIKVVDQSSNADITTSVLLQIVGDVQRGGKNLLSADFLASVIRLSDDERDTTLPQRLNAALRTAIYSPDTTRKETLTA